MLFKSSIIAVALFASLSWFSPLVPAQESANDDQVLQRIGNAMGSGDVRLLFQDAADRLVITMFGEEFLYSRGQAVYVLQDFFKRYPPARFNLQERLRTDVGQFAMGTYYLRGDAPPLRVYVRLRMKEDRWELREIRIEAVNR